MKKLILVFLFVFLIISCSNVNEKVLSYENSILKEKPSLKDDFYTNVNYEYLKNTEIEEGKTSNGNFEELTKKSSDEIKAIIKDLNDNYSNLKDGSDEKKLIDFYNMALDFETRDKLGISPIKDKLNAIKNVKNIKELTNLMKDNILKNGAGLYSFGVLQDKKNSDNQVLYIVPTPIGLSQEMYEDNEFAQNVRKAYLEYMKDLFIYIGYNEIEANEKANKVFDLEKELVLAKLSKEEQIDQSLTYNVYTLEELEKLTNNLDYVGVLKNLKIDKTSKIIVTDVKFMEKLNKEYNEENLETIKSLLELKTIASNVMKLSKDLIKIGAKYIQVYTGFYYIEKDEEYAYNLTLANFNELLGKLYVEKNFSKETKEDVIKMVNKIIKTYEKRISNLDWLTENTKEKALKKLETLNVKIGFPDKFKDYSKLTVKTYKDGGNLIKVIDELDLLSVEENLNELDKKPDKTKWYMTPQTVNAYYSSLTNEIVFTAAILQSPFYSPNASLEENLGAIGSIIGHEISHAFDSTGAQFDEKGNINNWWTEEDYKEFLTKVDKAAEIYSKLEVVPGYFVDGKISTGEIMADLGGLQVVVDIAKEENLDLKKLFESYAKVWRSVNTKESIISSLTDEHPYGKYRANNILNLIDEFYETYNIKENDKMYVKPEDRLKVW